MTKEIRNLTSKELKQYQQAMGVLIKLFDLTDEDVDAFFNFVKDAKTIKDAFKAQEERITSLERIINKEALTEKRELAKKATDALNRKNEELKIW